MDFSSSARRRATTDEAIQRLVTSITGRYDVQDEALARRILSSTIAIGSSSQDTVSGSLRRIERSTNDRAVRESVQNQLEELVRISHENGIDEKIAESTVSVLSKLASGTASSSSTAVRGNQNLSMAASANPRTVSNTTPESVKEEYIEEVRSKETLLLRECLYALQGMNGENLLYDQDGMLHLDYDNSACMNPALVSHSRIGGGIGSAFQACGEAEIMYRRVQAYINTVEASQESNSVARAWIGALSAEIEQYQSFVATLEADLQDPTSTLTLRQLMIRLRGPTARLRILAILTDGLKEKRGGQLLTGLHQHSLHGDSRHVNLVQTMVAEASRPWFHALYLWITQGILSEEEFFVRRNATFRNDNMWHDTFRIEGEHVPLGILDESLVRPVFDAGKGVNFIRLCLEDSQWSMKLTSADDGHDDTADDKPIMECFCYQATGPHSPEGGGYSSLAKIVQLAEKQVNAHICHSLIHEHDMLQHLRALKQFLLLGQGDFYSAVMEGLHAEFNRCQGVIGLYDYSLMGIVDGAIKNTNASKLPSYVLERLRVKLTLDEDDDARYMFAPPKHGTHADSRTGWDIFTLDYTVPETLTAIVHDRAMDQYRRVFSMLFVIKRVEFMLNLTWRQSATLQHAIQVFAQYNAINLASNKDYAQATALLRHIAMTRQAMMHFVVNLKSYLFFEVLEGAWKTLEQDLENGTSLDDFVRAHETYLDGIVHKSLLSTDEADGFANALAMHLQSMLSLALEFCTFQQDLFLVSTDKADQATQKRREAEKRSKAGDWGFASQEDIEESKSFFGLNDESKVQQVDNLGKVFNRNAHELLNRLQEIAHGRPSTRNAFTPGTNDSLATSLSAAYRDQFNHDSLQFLAFQLDYSSFYQEH